MHTDVAPQDRLLVFIGSGPGPPGRPGMTFENAANTGLKIRAEML
jgi:hypothetical protein